MVEVQPERLAVDTLLIANSVEVKDGLLYMLGGGWTRTWPAGGQKYPFDRPLAIGVLLRVPWNETNATHKFAITVVDDDGASVAPKIEGEFVAGRPHDLHQGMSQLVPLAATIPVSLKSHGIYHVRCVVDGEDGVLHSIEFEALERAPTK